MEEEHTKEREEKGALEGNVTLEDLHKEIVQLKAMLTKENR